MIEISDTQAYVMNDTVVTALEEMLGFIPTDEQMELKGAVDMIIPGEGFVSLVYSWDDQAFVQFTFNQDFEEQIAIRKLFTQGERDEHETLERDLD